MEKIGARSEDGIIELDENEFAQAQTRDLSDEDPMLGRFYALKED